MEELEFMVHIRDQMVEVKRIINYGSVFQLAEKRNLKFLKVWVRIPPLPFLI